MTTEQNLPKELESEVVARFQDCDPFGHLNNARYMDYLINAREDQLIHFYQINIYQHAEQTKEKVRAQAADEAESVNANDFCNRSEDRKGNEVNNPAHPFEDQGQYNSNPLRERITRALGKPECDRADD